MRKVNLRMNELIKYDVIKELVDHNENKNHAALNQVVAHAGTP